MLVYQEETHSYFNDGKHIPSVTQTIKEFFPLDPNIPAHVLEAARKRGKILHQTLEFLDLGVLEDYDPSLQWAVDAWDEWKFGKEIIAIEKMILHPDGLYAGRIDRVVKEGEKVYIVDIKTSVNLKLTPLQLHGYWRATDGNGLKIIQMRDKKLKEIEVDIDYDLGELFESMAKLWHYKRENKL